MIPVPGIAWSPPFADTVINRDPAAEANSNGGHWYRLAGADRPMPSVTTILDQSFKDGDALLHWNRRVIAEYIISSYKDQGGQLADQQAFGSWLHAVVREALQQPDKTANLAASFGTAVHNAIERVMTGQAELPQLPMNHEAGVKSALAFLEDGELTPLASEVTVYHPNRLYAGTVDCIARHEDGSLAVIDWKTGNGYYKKHDYQASAYAAAVSLMAGENVGHAYVVQLPRQPTSVNPPYKKHPVEDIFTDYATFRAIHDLWLRTHPQD